MAEVTDIKTFMPGWTATDTQVVKQFTVTVDSKDASGAVVIDSPLTPKVNDKLADNRLYIILPGGVNATRIDGKPYQWRFTATYTKSGFSFSSRDNSDRLLSFSAGSRVYTKTQMSCWESYNPITEERLRRRRKPTIPILNSVGDRFDPSDTQDEYINTVLTWTQRETRNFDYIGALDNKGTINYKTTTILGVPVKRGKGMLRNVDPVMQVDENSDFEWICTYTLELAEDEDFWLNILDRGYYAKINGKKKEITNADIKINRGEVPESGDYKTFASEPQALNGKGELAAWNAAESVYEAVYLDFRTKRKADWEKTLNLIAEEIRTV